MAHKSFSHKGYDIWIASKQPSKAARGGTKRSLQVCLPMPDGARMIKKQIIVDATKPNWFTLASEKAVKWIDEQPE